MKLKSILLALVSFLLIVGPVFAKVNFPDYSGYVNDFAEVLSPQFEADLNQNLADFEAKNTTEIYIATVKSLEDMTVDEYSIELAQKWGVGQKGKENGVLLLFAPNERKVRIEVGYGLESVLTDGRSGSIIDTEFIPEYRKGNNEQAILNTVNKIESDITASADIPQPPPENKSSVPVIEIILFFVLSGIPIYFLSYLSRSKEFYTGGVAGAAIGFLLGGFGIAFGLGLFGLLLDYLLSKNYKNLKSSGKSTNFWTSRGGFRSGGGFGGGGFGRTGGGSFGGGGASRSL